MKKNLLIAVFLLLATTGFAQPLDNIPDNLYLNVAERLLHTEGSLKIGGYGGVHYNQPIDSKIRQNGKLDVHRFIMLLGYSFSSKTQFISEIEFEHVKEVYIEQAFLQHKLSNSINLRAGLLLTPMGITNEYHEPTMYFGVERPLVDKYIAPTTWREIGAGFMGYVLPASIKYQAYIMNGFKSYDGGVILSAKGLRSGRQKAAESFISSPNFAGKVEYFGIRGLNLGMSLYAGKTQSSLYDGIEKDNSSQMAVADSSVVGITMLGLDARYSISGFQLKGQFYYTSLSNTDQYNWFTASESDPNGLGNSMTGYYISAGYNLLRNTNATAELTPFARYEAYNTQHTMAEGFDASPSFDKKAITCGVEWEMARGAILKADMQFLKSAADDSFSKVFNAGVGIMF